MATVKNTITMQDRMTPVLRAIIKSMQSTLDVMAGVDHVSNKAFRRAQSDVQAASEALDQFNSNLDEIPPRVDNAGSGFSKWKAGIVVANQAFELTKKAVGAIANQLINISDMTDQQSRLRAILGEGENIYDMQQLITRSAMDTRSSYEDTLESAVQMKAAMSEYGMSTQAAVRLSELMNKSLTLGGTK
jgi:archaellum component FlaC